MTTAQKRNVEQYFIIVVAGYVEMFSSSDIMCELYSDQVEVRHRSDLSSHK